MRSTTEKKSKDSQNKHPRLSSAKVRRNQKARHNISAKPKHSVAISPSMVCRRGVTRRPTMCLIKLPPEGRRQLQAALGKRGVLYRTHTYPSRPPSRPQRQVIPTKVEPGASTAEAQAGSGAAYNGIVLYDASVHAAGHAAPKAAPKAARKAAPKAASKAASPAASSAASPAVSSEATPPVSTEAPKKDATASPEAAVPHNSMELTEGDKKAE